MDTSWIFSLTTHPTDFVLSRLYNDIGQFLFFFFLIIYLFIYLYIFPMGSVSPENPD